MSIEIHTGERFFWLNEALKYIDISNIEIIERIFYIGLASKGVFSFKDIRNMDSKEYKFINDKTKEIIKSLYGDSEK